MTWVGRRITAADRAAGGLVVDVGLYALSALFAGLTARNVTLPPHGAWGRIAVYGYAAAAVLALGQAVTSAIARRRRWPTPAAGSTPPGSAVAGTPARAALAAATFAATALLPLIVASVQRAGGRTDRAQDEVLVVEAAGVRMWHTGSPYLGHGTIMALPQTDRLDAYFPYQPGMAVFGLPRAAFGVHWWTDARVWFAVALVATIAAAVHLLRRGAADGPLVLRGVQAATVFPVCALTLATGGDDMAVLGFCLLAFALAARGRITGAGVAVGIAGAMKLFAWPVALVLLALAATRGARAASRYALAAIGLPIISLVPALLHDRDAVVENVIRFPLGRTSVASPAASPLPGHLIATGLPDGRAVATVLLLLAGLAFAAWLLRRPPREAAAAAAISAWGLLAAILLIPATRFGYLLYPVAYAVWSCSVRREPSAVAPVAVAPSMAYGENSASG